MILYFARHASAGTPRQNPKLDDKRPLDKQGIRDCSDVGRMLSAMQVRVDIIISSPLKRALQTASLLATEIGHDSKIVQSDALKPQASLSDFRRLLADHSAHEAIMVVGHNPNFSEFLGAVISDDDSPAAINMKKGSVARVDVKNRGGELRWFLTPKVVRAVYESTGSSTRPKTSRK